MLFLTYHLPLPNEPGAFRPWMEARLLVANGFQVTVVTSGVQYMTGADIRPGRGWYTEERIDGVRVLRTWAPRDHRRSILRRIANYVSFALLAGLVSLTRVRRVDWVFAGTDPIFLMPVVWVVSSLKRAALVLDERDLFPETAIALGVLKEGVLSRAAFRMQQFFRRRARGIVAATPGIRQSLLEYGVPSAKVSLLYNADPFLTTEIATEVESLRERTGASFIVGYAGGLGRANDIGTLLRAAERLRDLSDLAVVVIGSGDRARLYLDYSRERNLTNVHFLPAVPRSTARAFLSQMDICVHLYPDEPLFRGALASKLLDYHGVGKPIVFCGRGDSAHLLQASHGGISVPPGDDEAMANALRTLYADVATRAQMGAAGKKWFEQHVSPRAAGQALLAAFET